MYPFREKMYPYPSLGTPAVKHYFRVILMFFFI